MGQARMRIMDVLNAPTLLRPDPGYSGYAPRPAIKALHQSRLRAYSSPALLWFDERAKLTSRYVPTVRRRQESVLIEARGF
jgi:hypothetical protein